MLEPPPVDSQQVSGELQLKRNLVRQALAPIAQVLPENQHWGCNGPQLL